MLEKDSKPKELGIGVTTGFPKLKEGRKNLERQNVVHEDVMSEIAQLLSPKNIEFLVRLNEKNISVAQFAGVDDNTPPVKRKNLSFQNTEIEYYDEYGRKIVDRNQSLTVILKALESILWIKDCKNESLQNFGVRVLAELDGHVIVFNTDFHDESFSIDQLLKVSVYSDLLICKIDFDLKYLRSTIFQQNLIASRVLKEICRIRNTVLSLELSPFGFSDIQSQSLAELALSLGIDVASILRIRTVFTSCLRVANEVFVNMLESRIVELVFTAMHAISIIHFPVEFPNLLVNTFLMAQDQRLTYEILATVKFALFNEVELLRTQFFLLMCSDDINFSQLPYTFPLYRRPDITYEEAKVRLYNKLNSDDVSLETAFVKCFFRSEDFYRKLVRQFQSAPSSLARLSFFSICAFTLYLEPNQAKKLKEIVQAELVLNLPNIITQATLTVNFLCRGIVASFVTWNNLLENLRGETFTICWILRLFRSHLFLRINGHFDFTDLFSKEGEFSIDQLLSLFQGRSHADSKLICAQVFRLLEVKISSQSAAESMFERNLYQNLVKILRSLRSYLFTETNLSVESCLCYASLFSLISKSVGFSSDGRSHDQLGGSSEFMSLFLPQLCFEFNYQRQETNEFIPIIREFSLQIFPLCPETEDEVSGIIHLFDYYCSRQVLNHYLFDEPLPMVGPNHATLRKGITSWILTSIFDVYEQCRLLMSYKRISNIEELMKIMNTSETTNSRVWKHLYRSLIKAILLYGNKHSLLLFEIKDLHKVIDVLTKSATGGFDLYAHLRKLEESYYVPVYYALLFVDSKLFLSKASSTTLSNLLYTITLDQSSRFVCLDNNLLETLFDNLAERIIHLFHTCNEREIQLALQQVADYQSINSQSRLKHRKLPFSVSNILNALLEGKLHPEFECKMTLLFIIPKMLPGVRRLVWDRMRDRDALRLWEDAEIVRNMIPTLLEGIAILYEEEEEYVAHLQICNAVLDCPESLSIARLLACFYMVIFFYKYQGTSGSTGLLRYFQRKCLSNSLKFQFMWFAVCLHQIKMNFNELSFVLHQALSYDWNVSPPQLPVIAALPSPLQEILDKA